MRVREAQRASERTRRYTEKKRGKEKDTLFRISLCERLRALTFRLRRQLPGSSNALVTHTWTNASAYAHVPR